jgi:hypothetical protein
VRPGPEREGWRPNEAENKRLSWGWSMPRVRWWEQSLHFKNIRDHKFAVYRFFAEDRYLLSFRNRE